MTFLDVFSIHYVTINIHLTFTFQNAAPNENGLERPIANLSGGHAIEKL